MSEKQPRLSPQALNNAATAALEGSAEVMAAPLPAPDPATAKPETIGGEGFVPQRVAQLKEELKQKMQGEVFAPLAQWTQNHAELVVSRGPQPGNGVPQWCQFCTTLQLQFAAGLALHCMSTLTRPSAPHHLRAGQPEGCGQGVRRAAVAEGQGAGAELQAGGAGPQAGAWCFSFAQGMAFLMRAGLQVLRVVRGSP